MLPHSSRTRCFRHRSLPALCLLLALLACGPGQEPGQPPEHEPAPVELPAAAPAQQGTRTPDLVLLGGKVYTVDPALPWADAIAILDQRIIAVGSNDDIAALAGPNTIAMDLGGRLVLPGINDAHVHAIWGGIKDLFQCNFPFSATPQEIAATVAGCVAAQTDSEWIQGGQWTSDFFVNNDIASPRGLLDAVSGDKAVVLNDDSGHNYWANSRALQLAGISAETPDPPGGYFVRDPQTGEPNGVLMESFSLIRQAVPRWTDEQHLAGARYAASTANAYGITAFKDASAEAADARAYQTLDREGGLTVRVATSLYAVDAEGKTSLDMAVLEQMRDSYRSPRVFTDFVKIFLDGVPTASRTAAMLEPYLPTHDGDEPVYGSLHHEPAALAAAVVELDRRGFTVKIHAAGDRSIRVALDAIEAARAANGDSGLRHELAHAEYIHPDDLPRFAALGAVADFSPYIWYPSPITESVVGALGARGKRMWPARDLLEHEAPMLAGSDWPAAVPDMNPWTGMEALVTRRDPAGVYPGSWWPEQALTLEEAIKIYTIDGAAALRLEPITGSISAGKSADLIVLNQDLFSIAPERIGDTLVDYTFFEGHLVHERAARAGGE